MRRRWREEIEHERAVAAKDFASSQEVRWCPGCGDYAVLKSVTRALADVGAVPAEDGVRVGHRLLVAIPVLPRDLRLPHDPRPRAGGRDGAQARESRARRLGRHGRRRRPVDRRQSLDARAASQRRLQDPAVQQRDLRPHERASTRRPRGPARARRRARTARSTRRSLPGAFALGAGAKFIARAIDVDKVGLGGVLEAAHGFDGAAFVEIFQNCIVYNDGVYNSFTDRDKAADAQIHVEHGEPLMFGENGSKGLGFDAKSMTLQVVDAKAKPDDAARPRRDEPHARAACCSRCRSPSSRWRSAWCCVSPGRASRRRTTRTSRRSSSAPAGLPTRCGRRALGTSRRSESFDGGRERRALARRAQRRSRAPRTSLPRHAKTPSMGLGGAHPCAPTVSGGTFEARGCAAAHANGRRSRPRACVGAGKDEVGDGCAATHGSDAARVLVLR